ncbi:hypothetical protein BH20ACI3_BH20ACI3_02090 [soil metagenome]
MRATKQLVKLAGLLSRSPISPDNHQHDELLAGLDAERKRLGQRRFAVVLNQQVYDYDGLTDYFFLIHGFDTQGKAMKCVDSEARELLALQLAQKLYDQPWVLESEGDMWALPKPKPKDFLRALYDRTYKLRAGPYDTKYTCFRVIGPFDKWIVSQELFDFLNCQWELCHYFMQVGDALRNGKPMPMPE